MNQAIYYIIPFLMAAVLVVLIAGIVNFTRRGHSPHTSNKLMQWRVILQGAVILLFLLFMLFARS